MMGQRYYSPELCRFIQPDSIEYLDPESINGLNLYMYCNDNPVMMVDPSGNMPKWLSTTLKILGGVAIVVGLVALTLATGGSSVPLIVSVVHSMAHGAFLGSLVSGIQWGLINTASTFLGSMGGTSTLNGALLSAIFGGVTGAIGMTIDILRNRKNQKQKVSVNNQLYAYCF